MRRSGRTCIGIIMVIEVIWDGHCGSQSGHHSTDLPGHPRRLADGPGLC